MRSRDALEILFEDGSESPFAVHLLVEQADRVPAASDEGRTFRLAIWTENGKRGEMPARYRRVPRLPWLEPWEEG